MISDLLEKNISGVIHPWDNFSEGHFSSGPIVGEAGYVGDKSFERQFSLGTTVQVEIVRSQLSSGKSSEGQLAVRQLSGDNYPGAIIKGAIVWGAIFLGAIVQTPFKKSLKNGLKNLYSFFEQVWLFFCFY